MAEKNSTANIDSEFMESLLRRLLPSRPWGFQHIDDEPPSLNQQAIARVRKNGCVAIMNCGGRIEITADEYEQILAFISAGSDYDSSPCGHFTTPGFRCHVCSRTEHGRKGLAGGRT